MNPFRKRTDVELQDHISRHILSVLDNYEFTHSEKVIVLNNVALKLKKQREEILNDIIEANSK